MGKRSVALRRLHTVNRPGNLECIDGSGNCPKYRSLLPGSFREASHNGAVARIARLAHSTIMGRMAYFHPLDVCRA
jgi:hypothetical protein